MDANTRKTIVFVPVASITSLAQPVEIELEPEGELVLSAAIESGDVRAYRFTRGDGEIEYVNATVHRTDDGKVRLEPV